MKSLPIFPAAVHRYVSKVFGEANRRLAEKIARVPNCPEPSLDLTLVEHLTQYSGGQVVAPGWAVRIDVHYLGGLRHFYRWEIADIGVLVFAKRGNSVLSKKVALLQSKRLYPEKHGIDEETAEDYRIGFGRLLPAGPSAPSVALPHQFNFTGKSAYQSLRAGDEQFKAIEAYEAQQRLPVHYLLYNPWKVDSNYTLPLTKLPRLGVKSNGGARIVPARVLRGVVNGKAAGYAPTFDDVATAISKKVADRHGWRLEHFMSGLLLKCKEGAVFESTEEANIDSLFNRRSGPIAAAVAVTIEQFD